MTLIGRLTKDQEVTDIWPVSELHNAYINVFFVKFEMWATRSSRQSCKQELSDKTGTNGRADERTMFKSSFRSGSERAFAKQ